jgi:hypothetical protein
MLKEHDISPLSPDAAAIDNDPNFFPLECGGAQAQLVRIQYKNGTNLPRLAAGPFVLRNKVWISAASNTVRTSYFEPSWFYYRAVRPQDFSSYVGTKPFTETDWEQIRDSFPQAEFPAECDEPPMLDIYEEKVTQAFNRKIELDFEKNIS